MKKLALITTAAAVAAIGAAPAAQAAPEQTLTVKLTKTKASKKKPTAVGITIDTGTKTMNPDGSKNTITSAKIDLPKGIALNYKAFPACADLTGVACADDTPGSQVGTGTAAARVDGVDYVANGTLTAFIGKSANLVIRTQFSQPAVIDKPLLGKVTTKGGAYSFGFTVPDALQMPLTDAYQQIDSFKLNFGKKTIKKNGKTVGLVELKGCTKKKYVFKGTFTFRDGSTATAEDTVKCSQAK